MFRDWLIMRDKCFEISELILFSKTVEILICITVSSVTGLKLNI